MMNIQTAYQHRVKQGEIDADPAQMMLVERMDELLNALKRRRVDIKSRALKWLFGTQHNADIGIKGLYIWGDVGRGKTMLMDLLLECVPKPARRAHFHAFMADVHERIFVYRQRVKRGEVKDADPIPVVATQLAQEAPFLCFDEFMVRDIADAMILGRLFTHLFAQGVIVVATSNVEPSRLYEGGLNRALFLPFLELMKQHMDVVRLDARTDFRMEKLGSEPVYIVADSKEAAKALTQLFKKMTGHAQAPSFIMTVKGRELVIPQAKDGVARLSFNELCRQPLGAGDYLAISQRFHTVMIDDIPIMGEEERNEAKRFMTLIDALYDNHVKVIATARAEPAQLYTATYGAETFEFARTVSRLMEMRSKDYLARPHGRQDSQASDDITGLVET